MTPFLSMRHTKSAFVGVRLVVKSIFFFSCRKETDSAGTNLSPFHLPALNTDVMCGGVRPSCDKEVMPMRQRARKLPPSHGAVAGISAGAYLQALIRKEKTTPIHLSHCKQ